MAKGKGRARTSITGDGESSEAQSPTFAERMAGYEVTLVDDVTADLTPKPSTLGQINPEVIARATVSNLNPGRRYDFRVDYMTADPVVLREDYSVHRGRTPGAFLRMVEKVRPDFVEAVERDRGFNQVYVSLARKD